MTIKELQEKSFNEAVNELMEDNYITTYDDLKEFAKQQIDDDNLFFAIHILTAINDVCVDYYAYDYSMGTLETPSPLMELDDLEDFCESEEIE